MELLDSCLADRSTFDPASSGKTLVCSFSDLAEALLLPGLLARLTDLAPNMCVRSYYVLRSELPRELAAGKLDFGVDVPFVNDSGLHHAELLAEEYGCAVRPEHPILRRRPTLERYLALGHVHVSSRRTGIGAVDQSLKALGRRRRIAVRVRDYTAATRIVASTDLACTLPRVLARQAGLRVYALPFEATPVSMHLYWHRSADADPVSEWSRRLLQDVASDVPGRPPAQARRRTR